MNPKSIRIADDVADGLAKGQAVVALESSVLAQGLPFPHNVESTRACCEAIRSQGAIPAVTAIIAGTPHVGLSEADIDALIAPENRALKVGPRDFAVAVAQRRYGATTVAGTCALADAVGIRLFATGGIGGVHREADQTFDISQDLQVIAKSRVAVVTAGAKAILDLPRTLEVLETLAVPVIGLCTNRFPAFYVNDSGLSIEHRADSPADAADILRARWDVLDERGGVIFANPIDEAHAADPDLIERAIATALAQAKAQGIAGKAVTPFLLSAVAHETRGESMKANLALLEGNARMAARIAVALAER
ncbi:MAG: pseudouridine-5'-phosphate glycosidase [Myxococcales bacterium]|jgi:pseudouridine-5'-phosphate glycosidase|nr:pseudouridine-5'-phosphate glycosidase [Myxococcales bacterium]